MKTTFLLMSLGFLGYTLYNKFYKNSRMEGAIAGIGSSGRQGRTGNLNFDKSVEAQSERGEGLTDESKTGIED
jgi:hypothetical protein